MYSINYRLKELMTLEGYVMTYAPPMQSFNISFELNVLNNDMRGLNTEECYTQTLYRLF